MSNLRSLKGNVVYIPFYMPSTNPDYYRENKDFISDAWDYLKQINKSLEDKDLINHIVIDTHLHNQFVKSVI